MVAPVIIAAGISAAAKGIGDYFSNQQAQRAAARRAKETKRETIANLLQDALQGSAELTAHGLSSREKLGKRKGQSMQDTADLMRGALSI